MNTSLNFLYIGYFFAIVIHVFSLVLRTFSVLKLQFKEVRVQDGLKKLRVQLLLSGVALELIEVVSIFVLTARYFVLGDIARYSIVILIVLHALGLLINTLTWRAIFQEQFSEHSIELHEKIEELDKKGMV